MELRNLKTFRTVADCLNFTKAAQKLFLAQSSVSAQIKTLEEDLGIKLFDRIGKKVLLTDAGEKLYGYARRMEEMTDEIKSEITQNKNTRGSLTIRVPETIAAIYMPDIINQFHKENPMVKLSFINCTDRQLKEELNTGRIDLAFLMTDSIHFEGINVELLKTENLVFACGPGHALAKPERFALKTLEKQTLLLARTDWSYRRALERSLNEINIAPRLIEFSSMTSLKYCLKMGMGVGFFPTISIQKELAIHELICLKDNADISQTSVIMIWHAQKWCSPALKEFMAAARTCIKA